MLFTYLGPRFIAVSAAVAICIGGVPASAKDSSENVSSNDSQTQAVADSQQRKPVLLAQAASCASCGAELDSLELLAADKQEYKSFGALTDSLWGNLILELAYQRDPELKRIAKRFKLVNLGTNITVAGVAGGTLAQGVTALAVLNPPAGHEDSYAPLEIGVPLSAVTLLAFMARTYCNHKLEREIVDRQMQIKKRVEGILHHMAHCQAACPDARKQLTELIGERACSEWVELWQSSHQLAMTPTPPRVSLDNAAKKVSSIFGASDLFAEVR